MLHCSRCGVPIGPDNVHHINGNHDDDSAHNKIGLCMKCHDFIQGICDKCSRQSECHVKRFRECWHFEDALPPIHFRSMNEQLLENQNENNSARSMMSVVKGRVHLDREPIEKEEIIYGPRLNPEDVWAKEDQRWYYCPLCHVVYPNSGKCLYDRRPLTSFVPADDSWRKVVLESYRPPIDMPGVSDPEFSGWPGGMK